MKISKKGVTLIEVMVTLAVSSIIIVAVLLAIQSFSGQYVSGVTRMRAKNVATLAGEYLEGAIKYSKRAYIDTSENAYNYNLIVSRDGRLYITTHGNAEALLMEERNFDKMYCRAVFSKYDDNTVHVEILVYKKDTVSSPLYTLKRDIRLLNSYDADREFGIPADKVTYAAGVSESDRLKYI